MLEEDNLLDNLLSAAVNELSAAENNNKTKCLKETNIFEQESNVVTITETVTKKLKNILHNGDTDSSDDEGNKYFENQKYNECGKEIKYLLEAPSTSKQDNNSQEQEQQQQQQHSSSWKSKKNIVKLGLKDATTTTKTFKSDVYTDPVFGIRIVKPLVSSVLLQERMAGREAVPFSKITNYIQNKNNTEQNWVIGGVIINKSAIKTSQKGNQFAVWSLSDLRNDIKTISLFLFGNAYKQLWKTITGTVVGILNPTVLDKKDGSKDEACLSIDNAQRVMIIGQSKDLGVCKSKKKNGEQCTAIVNISRCEFCLYHIKQEYQKCSKRSELQSSFSGGRNLTALRNKVLGKNEVFYAGKSYMAIPAKKNKKLQDKDEGRLLSLNSNSQNIVKAKNLLSRKKKGLAAHLDLSQKQRLKDLDLLKKLSGNNKDLITTSDFNASQSNDVTVENSRSLAIDVIAKLKANKCNNKNLEEKITEEESQQQQQSKNIVAENKPQSKNGKVDRNLEEIIEEKAQSSQQSKSVAKKPCTKTLGTVDKNIIPMLKSVGNNLIDLNIPIKPKGYVDRAKLNALKFVEKNGPLAKIDPNNVKSTTTGGRGNKKRQLEDNDDNNMMANKNKKPKLIENADCNNEFITERFKKMMEATSKHMDLLESHDNDERDKYFEKLEAKERMEEKMINTYKVQCKAVRCLKCKYTNFSASDFCKQQRHPLKVFDAIKRFFQCTNCNNRTVCLEIIPTKPCNNCNCIQWERTGMMKERKTVVTHNLSIRGGEQKFVNSVIVDNNINLLMSSEDQ